MFRRWRDRYTIRRLRLAPGDGLVIRTDKQLSDEQAAQMVRRLRSLVATLGHSNVPVVIVDASADLEVWPGAASRSAGQVEGQP